MREFRALALGAAAFLVGGAAALALSMASAGPVSAALCTSPTDCVVTGSGTSNIDMFPISATADFSFNPGTNTLTITLTNTGAPLNPVPPPAPEPSNSSVLTELLFNGTPATTTALPSAAGTAAGNIVIPNGTTVGQNWQYIPGTGVGTTGINFGPDGNLCGNPTTPPCNVPVDGADMGVVPAGSALTTDGLPKGPFVEPTATFTLVFPAGFSLLNITSASFVYGTMAGDDTVVPGVPFSVPGVPEPGSLVLLGTALAGWGWLARRRKRAVPAASGVA